jgi:cobalamin synthase
MVDGLRRALGFLTVYPLRASDAWTPETLGSSMMYHLLVGIHRVTGDWRCCFAAPTSVSVCYYWWARC